jgi:hypothetical protein
MLIGPAVFSLGASSMPFLLEVPVNRPEIPFSGLPLTIGVGVEVSVLSRFKCLSDRLLNVLQFKFDMLLLAGPFRWSVKLISLTIDPRELVLKFPRKLKLALVHYDNLNVIDHKSEFYFITRVKSAGSANMKLGTIFIKKVWC